MLSKYILTALGGSAYSGGTGVSSDESPQHRQARPQNIASHASDGRQISRPCLEFEELVGLLNVTMEKAA